MYSIKIFTIKAKIIKIIEIISKSVIHITLFPVGLRVLPSKKRATAYRIYCNTLRFKFITQGVFCQFKLKTLCYLSLKFFPRKIVKLLLVIFSIRLVPLLFFAKFLLCHLVLFQRLFAKLSLLHHTLR